jgi:hypothetical protein
MIYADETMVTPNKFLFPENSDKHGIHRESQPALRLRIGQARKKASLAARRCSLTWLQLSRQAGQK